MEFLEGADGKGLFNEIDQSKISNDNGERSIIIFSSR